MFKIGDRVRIVNLNRHPRDPGIGVGMQELIGNIITLTRISEAFPNSWGVDENDWLWDGHWLELVGENPVRFDKNGRARLANGRFAKKPGEAIAKKYTAAIPKPVKQVYKDIREELKERCEIAININPHALQYKNGTKCFKANEICYSYLRYADYRANPITKFALNVSSLAKTMAIDTQNNYKNYVNWLINESPWASVFITKDVEEAFDKGIFLDVDRGVNAVINSAVALRTFSEFGLSDTWAKHIANGVSPVVAWLLCQTITEDGRSVRADRGHSCVGMHTNYQDVIKFLKNGFSKEREGDKFSITGRYQVYGAIGEEHAGVSLLSTIQSFATVKGKGFHQYTEIDKQSIAKFAAKAEQDIKELK